MTAAAVMLALGKLREQSPWGRVVDMTMTLPGADGKDISKTARPEAQAAARAMPTPPGEGVRKYGPNRQYC